MAGYAAGDESRSKIATVLRVTSGNFLEMFDFFLFGFYATYISRSFFPTGSEFASLMLTFMTFGAGFLMRPLGAIFLGAYVDTIGQVSSMSAWESGAPVSWSREAQTGRNPPSTRREWSRRATTKMRFGNSSAFWRRLQRRLCWSRAGWSRHPRDTKGAKRSSWARFGWTT